MNTNKHRLFWVLVCLLPCAALADGLAGLWSGAVSQGGDSYTLDVTFSRDGYPIFSYTNNKNFTRERELHVTIVNRTNGYMGDHEMSAIDRDSQSVAKGVLRRRQ